MLWASGPPDAAHRGRTTKETAVPTTPIDDPRYVKALRHPLRVRILALLEEETSSPVQLSKVLRVPLGTVAYHVRTLHELGLLKEVGTTPRRGAVEHHYRAKPRPRPTRLAWERASPVAKQAVTDAELLQILDVCRGAAAAGGFDRGEAIVERRTLELDERGWVELARAYGRLQEAMSRIEGAAAARLRAARGEGRVAAGAVLMLFEGQRYADLDLGADGA